MFCVKVSVEFEFDVYFVWYVFVDDWYDFKWRFEVVGVSIVY